MKSQAHAFPPAKCVCIVSPEEDFRLKLAALLSSTCHITVCGAWDSLIDVARTHNAVIAVVDSLLWRSSFNEIKRAMVWSLIDHPVSIIRLYLYQLEEETVEKALQYHVDSIWMRKFLSRTRDENDFMASIYRPLSSHNEGPFTD